MMKGLRFMRELFKDLSLKKAYKIYYTQEEEALLLLWFWFCCCICNEWVLRGGGREKQKNKMHGVVLLILFASLSPVDEWLSAGYSPFFPTPRDGKREYRKVVAAATKYVQDSPLPLNKLYDWLDSILTETLSASPGRNRRNGEKLFAK
jgi:hypothetical protein